MLDAIKAIGCVVVVWHHLAVYSPMLDNVMPLSPLGFAALYNHGQLAVQAFLVVAGFLAGAQLWGFMPLNAPGLSARFSVFRLLSKRFLRLAIPMLTALTLTVCMTALVRPWYPHESLSDAPTLWDMVAHSLMLQDLIGVPALSAGIWYVAIDFQLFAVAVLCVWLAGRIQVWQPRMKLRAVTVALWFLLAAVSLFWWNRQDDMDVQGLYFLGSYGLGMLAYRISLSRVTVKGWAVVFVLGCVALWLEPRVRMGVAWVLALILAAWPSGQAPALARAGRRGWQGLVANFAKQSYAVFLVHFAVSLPVSAFWFRAGWHDPWANLAGMCFSFVLTLGVAAVLYRAVESGPATWKRWLQWALVFLASGGLATLLA